MVPQAPGAQSPDEGGSRSTYRGGRELARDPCPAHRG